MWQKLWQGVDSRQISLDAQLMLQMLDLVSLARLAGCERLRYESEAQINEFLAKYEKYGTLSI